MLSKEEVINIAKLARLDLTEKEIEKMQKDLAGILDYIDQLNKVDISGVEYMHKFIEFYNLKKIKNMFISEKIIKDFNYRFKGTHDLS